MAEVVHVRVTDPHPERAREDSAAERIDRTVRVLKEYDIVASPDSLVVRNLDEYLLLVEYRERKLEQAKTTAREVLKQRSEAPVYSTK